MPAATFPDSIRGINALPQAKKQSIYRTLIPQWVADGFGIRLDDDSEQIRYMCPQGSRAVELSVRRSPTDRDPILFINMADTFNGQLLVLLVVVNDPDAPRYNVDMDAAGHPTNFGTSARNLAAEREAMEAGLSPGQIRRGLRAFRQSVPIFEEFVRNMQHDLFFIEPLSYHNAIVFERYGFNYLRGLGEMRSIHAGFQPGGELSNKLTPGNPFRHPDYWNSVRGRAWAIHDGILGHPYTGFQMYKRVGQHAGVNTFPDAQW